MNYEEFKKLVPVATKVTATKKYISFRDENNKVVAKIKVGNGIYTFEDDDYIYYIESYNNDGFRCYFSVDDTICKSKKDIIDEYAEDCYAEGKKKPYISNSFSAFVFPYKSDYARTREICSLTFSN